MQFFQYIRAKNAVTRHITYMSIYIICTFIVQMRTIKHSHLQFELETFFRHNDDTKSKV